MNSKRVFIIGLDGATFDLLNPWIKEGRLPNLKKILEQSAYGPLESTIPPLTPPAWTSFMTGVNPGKHGIRDFFTFKPNSFEKVLVNSSHIRSKRFWDLAGERGKKSIILYVPFTYPPQKTEGIMISGIPVPYQEGHLYPEELKMELEDQLGKWWSKVDMEQHTDSHQERILGEFYKNIDIHFGVAEYLMQKEWDLFVFVTNTTDWAQHLLWGKKEECLLPLYVKIDKMIGHFIGALRQEDVVLILSDHGFGPIRKTVYLNTWLREKGFLKSKRKWGYVKEMRLSAVFHHQKRPSWINRIKWAFGKRNTTIDWKNTLAYFDNTGSTNGIRINLIGREPEGIVKPEEYDAVRNRVMAELHSMMDEQEGRKVIERIYRIEDVYWGPYIKDAPDILFIPDGDYRVLNGRIKDKVFKKSKEGESFHRLDGILILSGPGIEKGKMLSGAHMMDIAPTILYLLGCPVPKGMDGRILTEALEPKRLKDDPVKYEDISLDIENPQFAMSHAEEEDVKKSLKGLGYLG